MKKNKKKITIINREDNTSDKKYWLSKTAEERISAVEFLREQFYIQQGYKETPRLHKVITIRKRNK